MTTRLPPGAASICTATPTWRLSLEVDLGQEPLQLFQIWLRPRQAGGEPRWDARRFPKADRANQFVVLASGFAVDVDALRIRAGARVLGATRLAGSELKETAVTIAAQTDAEISSLPQSPKVIRTSRARAVHRKPREW